MASTDRFTRSYLAATAGLLMTLGVGGGLAETAAERSQVRVRQVWADSRTNTLGQPSLDGRYISYTDWETGDLGLRDLRTGKSRRLTHNGRRSKEYAYFSTVSPDGRQVAYAWFNKEKSYELRLISTEAGSAQLPPSISGGGVVSSPGALPTGTPVLQPSYLKRENRSSVMPRRHRVLYRSEEVQFIKPTGWSADSKQILALFFGKSILNQIVLVSAEDGSVKILKSTFWIYPKRMSLSPDGRYVVYGLNQEPPYLNRDIYVLPTDGSPEITLVQDPANDLFPVWSPDGGSVLFASNRGGTLDAWVISVADGKAQGPPVMVKKDIGRFLPLGFQADGTFYYGLRTGDEDAYITSLDPKTGKPLDSRTRVSERFVGVNRSPDWSPDGKQLAYLARVGTENQGLDFRVISIRTPATGEERQVGTPKLSYLNWLRWAPDSGSFLVGGSDTNNQGGLYRVDAETGKVSSIVRGEYAPPRGYVGVWSASGEGVFYAHEDLRETSTSIRYRDLESGDERELYHAAAPWRLSNLALSPDGEMLAFGMSKGNLTEAEVLLVMPVAGGDPREVLKLGRAELSGVEWTRDGKYLLFSRAGEPTAEMWRVSIEKGQPRSLGLATNENARISVHPDGRRIAHTAGQTHIEIWAMENFLPQVRAGR